MRSAAILWVLGVSGCTAGGPPALESPIDQPGVKNVIVFIGDGMGPQQIGLLEVYANRAPGSVYDGPTTFQQIMDAGQLGLSRHGSADALVVDSACSASQLATGVPSLSEAISLDVNGQPVQTILEFARSQGLATGLVSDTRITHATPAAFAAHVPHRSQENEIAVQLLEAGPDVMLSGGLRYFIPQSVNDPESSTRPRLERLTGGMVEPLKSKRKDERNLLFEARDAGYSLAFDRETLAAAGDRVLGLFAYSGMQDGIDQHLAAGDQTEPTLAEMTDAAITRLSKDEDGFFLMVEAGQIDWAGHNNDAGQMLHEMIKMDEALEVALAFARDREDTLLLITADHETGGFGLSYSRAGVLAPRTIPGGAFEEQPYSPNFNFASPDVLDQLYAQKSSFHSLLLDFQGLPEAEQTAERLMVMFNAISAFPITLEQAGAVLASEPNNHRVHGHGTLDVEQFPRFEDFEAFYPFGEMSRVALFARQVASAQSVVWATGAHTHTPVLVVSHGPRHATEPFTGMMHHTDVGEELFNVLR